MKIFYIDGNPQNNRIDNLYVNPAYIKERTKEQIDLYNEKALLYVKWALKYFGYSKAQKYGYDIDNVIGESLYLIWLYLPSYNSKKIALRLFVKSMYALHFLKSGNTTSTICKLTAILSGGRTLDINKNIEQNFWKSTAVAAHNSIIYGVNLLGRCYD